MNNTDLDRLHDRFNEETVSRTRIAAWLNQFDAEDRAAALHLAGLVDYWGYRRVHFGLRALHDRLMNQLRQDGYVPDAGPAYQFDRIDFSRAFCSKSGDLISYFYRKMNGMRSLEFNNLEALECRSEDLSRRALVILDDYVGTGSQFLSFCYRTGHPRLFNRYGRVYLAVLVANKLAIDTFRQVNHGNREPLVKILCGVDGIENAPEIEQLRKDFSVIRPGHAQLIYAQKEISLLDPKGMLNANQRTRISKLIGKYTQHSYCHGLFNVTSHSVFFFQCPNDTPQILWDWDCGPQAGEWYPLFPRVSDSSIYAHDGNIPLAEQVAGKLWE